MSTDLGKKAALAGGLVLVALICAGCGPAAGTLSGTVTYKDKPLPGGTISFMTATGSGSARIGNDGTYTLDDAPVGDAKVAVYYSTGPKGMPTGKGGGIGKDASPEAQEMLNKMKGGGPKVSFNAKYSDMEASGLTVKIAAGKNPPFNVELKD